MSLRRKELLEDGSLALIFALAWICPCANFYFILFSFFAYSKPCIVFILSLGGEGGHGMRILVTYIWVNQWWSHLADGVPSLCPLGGTREHVVLTFFRGIHWKRWRPEMGQAQETNINNKSKDASSKKIRSIEKDQKAL